MHSTQHTAHSAQHTAHSAQHTAHSELRNPNPGGRGVRYVPLFDPILCCMCYFDVKKSAILWTLPTAARRQEQQGQQQGKEEG